MACPTGNPVLDAAVGFFGFLSDPIGTIVEGIANAVLAGAISVFGALTTNIPTLLTDGSAKDVNRETNWIVVYLAVGSLVFASIKMALDRRGDAGNVALKGLLRVVVVAGAATAVMTALASLADRYSDHLFRSGAQEQMANIGCGDGSGIEGFLLLVLAFLLLIAGIVHTILLYVRLGVMILLLGTLPVAAAASMTDWGSGWWRKHIGWMIAWLLYKPAAGLVMYAGSSMISSTTESAIHEKIAGIGVMLLSAIALPALMKLVVPATAGLGGGGAGGATTGVAGRMASGVKSSGSSAGSGGGRSAPVADGPTGAVNVTSGQAPQGGAMVRGARGGAVGGGAAGGRAAAGAGAAGAALGPAGAVAGAAVSAGRHAANAASGAVEGADGDWGHHGR